MKRKIYLIVFLQLVITHSVWAQTFEMQDVLKFPFPSELISSEDDEMLAWTMNEEGKRNIYLAQKPDFTPIKLTEFNEDDGQKISRLQFSPDGNFLVFVRGGDRGTFNDQPVNPGHKTTIPEVEVWKINLAEKKVEKIGKGENPTIGTPHHLAFIKEGQVWSANLANDDGPRQLFEAKGNMGSLKFSPDGDHLLFVAKRDGYSFIGILKETENIHWLAPGFFYDQDPQWSSNGKRVAFIRTPGGRGSALPILEQRHSPWEIWVADIATGESYQRWKSPETLAGSVPTVHGGFNFHWASDNQLVFLSYEDGWPGLYAIDASSGDPRSLTPGEYHVEHVHLSPDNKKILFSANAGPDPEDRHRRHIGEVAIAGGEVTWRTSGNGIETYPVYLGKEERIAYLSATAKRPPLPEIQLEKGKTKLLAEDFLPPDFPLNQIIEPRPVSFLAPDGTLVYGQVFKKENGNAKKPGVVFVHGGPQRQMLLGWHYSDYYANTYAINQFLANSGFVVLAVNYRLGIGYGHEFHKPANTYYRGAAEYQDVKAAGEFLAKLPQVNSEKIGIYGGSYGGYLTALALGKDSDLFKVGVDIHGVHDFERRNNRHAPEGYEVAPDYEEAKKVAWESSPLAYLDSWKSPVLFIHGDDDRNVDISQTTDLIRRFEEKNLPYEFLMIPDDTHHWMKFSNLIKVDKATTEFLSRHLKD